VARKANRMTLAELLSRK